MACLNRLLLIKLIMLLNLLRSNSFIKTNLAPQKFIRFSSTFRRLLPG